MHNILVTSSDGEIQAELGHRLRALRLQQNLTVADVARRAAVHRNTIVNAEAGRNPRLGTVVRLLRVYGRVEVLEGFLPAVTVSPLQVVKGGKPGRRRASGHRRG